MASRGSGRELEGHHNPVILTDDATTPPQIDVSSISMAVENLSSPPLALANNRKNLTENSIQKQSDRGISNCGKDKKQSSSVPLLGPGGQSILLYCDSATSKVEWAQLFGGTIVGMMPSVWRDVSDVRQVPDHQEVWQDCGPTSIKPSPPPPKSLPSADTSDSSDWLANVGGTGACVIFEIMERQESVPDAEAPAFFFNDLAESNGCAVCDVSISWSHVFKNCEILPGIGPTKGVTVCALLGEQKFGLGKDKDIESELTQGDPPSASTRPTVPVSTAMVIIRLANVQTDFLIIYTREVTDGVESNSKLWGGSASSLPRDDSSSIFLPFDPVLKMILETLKIDDWSLFC